MDRVATFFATVLLMIYDWLTDTRYTVSLSELILSVYCMLIIYFLDTCQILCTNPQDLFSFSPSFSPSKELGIRTSSTFQIGCIGMRWSGTSPCAFFPVDATKSVKLGFTFNIWAYLLSPHGHCMLDGRHLITSRHRYSS